MAVSLTLSERETIIIFNEAEDTAQICTYNGGLIRKLSDLCEARPGESTGKAPNQYGEAFYTVPKKWIKVNAGPVLTDAERERRRKSVERFNRQN